MLETKDMPILSVEGEVGVAQLTRNFNFIGFGVPGN
jgi:hypothetical protein